MYLYWLSVCDQQAVRDVKSSITYIAAGKMW
jgi:hypothetical protein